MSATFRLLMISAMYENGGNTTHRLLDGHPELFVYPFESQLGTSLVSDRMSSLFPLKYRWPAFDLDATADQDYRAIIDEETKVRARTPQVSKFRHVAFELNDEERLALYRKHIERDGRSRASNAAAFFRATFEAWKNHKRSGKESVYVGYSPIVVVDAEKILADLSGAVVLHIVRNPWSAYADTKRRAVPLSLADYMLAWCVSQHHALMFQAKFPGRVRVLRFEDVIADPEGVLGGLCQDLGVGRASALAAPSWNGEPLSEIYPWGTIRLASPAANRSAALELSYSERSEVALRAGPFLERLNYGDFLN